MRAFFHTGNGHILLTGLLALPVQASAHQLQTPEQVPTPPEQAQTRPAPQTTDPQVAPHGDGGATSSRLPQTPAPNVGPSQQTRHTGISTQPNTVVPATGVVPDTPMPTPITAAPNWPVDFSDQYTETIAGVPIIENPASCGKNPLELRITVDNVKKTEGTIVADLHDDKKENFLVWDKVVLRIRATAQQGQTSFCMPLPKPGDYAVAVYHDKNANKKFDKNFLGIPKERFGMSTNPKFGTRTPKYENAVFTIGETSQDMNIILRKASDIL